ncbi:adhesion G protein-coupled receptor E1-like [Salminus brasiliensis]|uniref:adhesion G protein-coupled receptor E1-like n=1 Tax=Salminus brasiliensis TaxID=930266 RepID=UPI003B8373DC
MIPAIATLFWINPGEELMRAKGIIVTIADGIVTRQACGSSMYGCCSEFVSIRVKACPGNYYVYEFKSTAIFTVECVEILLNQIKNSTDRLIRQTVDYLLEKLLNSTEILEDASSNQTQLTFYGNFILNATEKLVSSLVHKTDTSFSDNISLPSLEASVIAIGPNISLTKTPQIKTSKAFLESNLIEISKHSKDALIFMSYANMSRFLKPSFFNTSTDTKKTMMSTVVTVKLLCTTNQPIQSTSSPNISRIKHSVYNQIDQSDVTSRVTLTAKQSTEPTGQQPELHFKVILEHLAVGKPKGILSCVNWRETEWVEGSCEVILYNSSFTICSCVHPGTFALIMQTSGSSKSTPFVDLLNTVAMAVGLVFLSLTLVTFAFCQKKSIVIKTALINLCLSLLLAHLLFLLTQKYLLDIHSVPMLCAVLAGVLHFLFLSAFVWMFIEAVLLFISVKNLTKIRSKQKEILSWKCLAVIGYIIPLVVVGVSVGLFPDGYGSPQCWLKFEKGLLWSFLGPVCFILASNLILFIIISIIMISTLKKLNSPILQTSSDNICVKSVMVKTLLQFVIIGCPWILGFFTESSEAIKILFLIINSQQGTFIFFIHCVFNREVRRQYKRLLCSFCFCPSDLKTVKG